MSRLPLALMIGAALSLTAGCNQKGDADKAATPSPSAAKAAGGNTIAAGLDSHSRFLAAAKAAGLDATLAGPGPYTVLVPTDAAFAKLPAGTVDNLMKPESKPQLTALLTTHILPGTMLAADIGKAIDAGHGKAQIATMGGGTITAMREGSGIGLSDSAGNKAMVSKADEQRSNGVVHEIDTVLAPGK